MGKLLGLAVVFACLSQAATVYISDNCNRSSGTGWGTASSGTATTKTWSANTTSYQANGTVCGFNDSFGYGVNRIGDVVGTDIEAYAEFTGVANIDREHGFRLKVNSTGVDFYRIVWLPNIATTKLTKVVNTSGTDVATATSQTYNAAKSMRARIDRTTAGAVRIRVRTWTASGAEPTTWSIDYTDSTTPFLSGGFGVELGNDGSSQVKVDNISFVYYPGKLTTGINKLASRYDVSPVQ